MRVVVFSGPRRLLELHKHRHERRVRAHFPGCAAAADGADATGAETGTPDHSPIACRPRTSTFYDVTLRLPAEQNHDGFAFVFGANGAQSPVCDLSDGGSIAGDPDYVRRWTTAAFAR